MKPPTVIFPILPIICLAFACIILTFENRRLHKKNIEYFNRLMETTTGDSSKTYYTSDPNYAESYRDLYRMNGDFLICVSKEEFEKKFGVGMDGVTYTSLLP